MSAIDHDIGSFTRCVSAGIVVERPGISVYQHMEKKEPGNMYSFVRLKPVSGYASPLALLRVLVPLVKRVLSGICLSTGSTRYSVSSRSRPRTRHGGRARRRRRKIRFRGAREAALAARRHAVARRFKIERYWFPVGLVRGVYLELDIMGRS
jgi:hypothetical protein